MLAREMAGIAAIFGRSRDDPAAANRATPLLNLRWTFPAKRASVVVTDSEPDWLNSSPCQRPVGLRGVWVVAAREALAQIAARGGVAASFREVAFPMASAKEHQSRTETFARRSILCDASAPQRLARRPYCLGPTVGSDQSESVDSARCKSASMLYIGVGL